MYARNILKHEAQTQANILKINLTLYKILLDTS